MLKLLASTCVLVVILFVAAQQMFSIAHQAQGAQAAGKPPVSLLVDRGRQSAAPGASAQEMVIDRDASGQFHIDVRVNGEDAAFMVDTGADVVALTTDEAQRLGIDVQPADFAPIMQTASGAGNAARVNIDRLELGGEEFSDIGAVVAEGLHENLLGQSVLRRLGRIELRGDQMVIHPR